MKHLCQEMLHQAVLISRCGLALKQKYLTGRATFISKTTEQQKNNDNDDKPAKAAAATSTAAESTKTHKYASLFVGCRLRVHYNL